MSQKNIDLIIPVYKPDEKFKYLISNILKQTIVPNSIILMHTVTKLDKVNLLDSFIDYKEAEKKNCEIIIHRLDKREFDHGATRNKGASISKSELIMFMTQDAIPADEYLVESLIECFSDDEVVSCYARQLPHAGATLLERYSRSFNYPSESRVKSKVDMKELGIKTYFCSNVCAAYKKDKYLELGGFVTKTIFNEDMIMAHEVIENGYKITYSAKAKVLHSHTYTWTEQLKRNFDLAVSQVEYNHIFSKVKSESEGIKFVKDTTRFLMEQNKIYLVPTFIIESAFKFIGYKLGKNYKKLPKFLIVKISMNPSYWVNK